MIKIKVSYPIIGAINDLKLGICKSYFIDWALASGYSRSTAENYWRKAKKLLRQNPQAQFEY